MPADARAGFREEAMINNYNDPGWLECPRAFRTDSSWYEAYWYREPVPRHPSLFNRSIARLVDAFQRSAVSQVEFAEIFRAGAAWALRAIRERQSQSGNTVGNPQVCAKTCNARRRIAFGRSPEVAQKVSALLRVGMGGFLG